MLSRLEPQAYSQPRFRAHLPEMQVRSRCRFDFEMVIDVTILNVGTQRLIFRETSVFRARITATNVLGRDGSPVTDQIDRGES